MLKNDLDLPVRMNFVQLANTINNTQGQDEMFPIHWLRELFSLFQCLGICSPCECTKNIMQTAFQNHNEGNG